MRTAIRLLFFALTLLCGAEEIGLDTLPWTDAAYSWTPDGPALPQINRNLSGKGPIRIGGKTFSRGICGHTGFSIVYRLDRTADSFSAWFGIDEEQHPKDRPEKTDVRFIILTDHRKVVDRTLPLGAKAEKAEIDLRGVHQLELRGEYGCGFRLQRVAWAEAVFRTRTPEKLRAALKRNRLEHERKLAFIPEYPSAPDWKNKQIRKVRWNGFENAWRIEWSSFEALLLPEYGGRIMEFRKKGGENLLKTTVFPGPERLLRGKTPDRSGGHFMRFHPSPAFYPNDPLLKHAPYTIAFPAEGEIVMTSPESTLFRIIFEYRLKLEPDGLSVENRIINKAPYRRELGIWSITRLETSSLARLLLPPERRNPPAKLLLEQRGNLLNLIRTPERMILDLSTNPPERFSFAQLRCWSDPPEIRTEGRNGTRMRIRYQTPAEDLNGEYPVHIFINSALTEEESHSQTLPREAGEALSFREHWSIE